MWIHSIVSPYAVFGGEESCSYNYHTIQGGMVECITNGRDIRVSRLITTDPKLYLNPKDGPGQPFPGEFPS